MELLVDNIIAAKTVETSQINIMSHREDRQKALESGATTIASNLESRKKKKYQSAKILSGEGGRNT